MHVGHCRRKRKTEKLCKVNSVIGFSREFRSNMRHFFQGAGTTETTLIDILCTRTNEQIEAIKHEYKRCRFPGIFFWLVYMRDGVQGGSTLQYARLISGLILIPLTCDCLVRGSKQCPRFEYVRYVSVYKTKIEEDVEGDTSFCFKRLLISMLAVCV